MSKVLKHNFFANFAVLLPAQFSTDEPINLTYSEKIKSLEQEIVILKAEKAVLLQLHSK